MCSLFGIISVFTVEWSGEAPQLYVLFRATGVSVGSTCTPNAPCCYHFYSFTCDQDIKALPYVYVYHINTSSYLSVMFISHILLPPLSPSSS